LTQGGTDARPGGLHEYYQRYGELPTFAGFTEDAALGEYARKRAILMDKLRLPIDVFRGARIIEFGPDSGENALVFAGWGGNVTLVEPNPAAWPKITAYFDRFDVRAHLQEIRGESIQDFTPERDGVYDVAVAEGFIYTVRPTRLWTDLFARLLRPGGFALVSYQQRTGSFFEFLMKLVQARYRGLTGASALDSARALFTVKWASVPHTRRFESWVMDVLENPYVRREFAYDAGEFYEEMAAAGIPIWGSWPEYTDALRVHWHKQEVPRDVRIAHDRLHIERSQYSFALGSKAYLCHQDPAEMLAAARLVHEAVDAIDAAIGHFDPAVADRAIRAVEGMASVVASGPVLIEPVADRPAPAVALASAAAALRACAAGDADRLAEFCATDAGFIGAWGQPAHLVSLRRDL
jgi:hypothetical protein